MVRRCLLKRLAAGLAVAVFTGGGGTGCHAPSPCCQPPAFDPCCLPDAPVPKELNKVSLPPYVIETPDILRIDVARVIPLPPYRIEPFDQLHITGKNVFEADPINGVYPVEPDGTINLGPAYGGAVRVVDLTTDEIQRVVQNKVRMFARPAEILVSLARSHEARQVGGQQMVRPDGTVGLGNFGSVYVAGMTPAQAKTTIETHLAQYLYRPEVTLEVTAYNSKVYYVITDLAGAGQRVVKLPHTGSETVLDAVSNVGGLSSVSSKKMWVARPSPTECGQDQILPVDWCGITMKGQVKTNYQLLPGDRVFILGRPCTRFETACARLLAPVRQPFGTGPCVPTPVGP